MWRHDRSVATVTDVPRFREGLSSRRAGRHNAGMTYYPNQGPGPNQRPHPQGGRPPGAGDTRPYPQLPPSQQPQPPVRYQQQPPGVYQRPPQPADAYPVDPYAADPYPVDPYPVDPYEQAPYEPYDRYDQPPRAYEPEPHPYEQPRRSYAEERARKDDRARTIATVVHIVTGLIATIFVLHIVFVLFGANTGSGIVAFVNVVAKSLVLGFEDVFNPGSATIGLILNYGLAAIVYFVIGRLIVGALRRR